MSWFESQHDFKILVVGPKKVYNFVQSLLILFRPSDLSQERSFCSHLLGFLVTLLCSRTDCGGI